MAKKYFLLGSCRVVNTIAYEAEPEDLIINKNDLWFTHYLQEHIQKIGHLFLGKKIPKEHKELFVRYEQENHYKDLPFLKIAESLNSNIDCIEYGDRFGILNVLVELPTVRYIKVPINEEVFWGHTTNIDLIRESPFNQIGGNSTDEEFLSLMKAFELLVTNVVSSLRISEGVNFLYVPHVPFIELGGGGWGISDQRVHIFNLIKKYCAFNNQFDFPVSRSFLDVRNMIDENGGVDFMLDDQNHYSEKGRKVVFKYLDFLSV